MAIAVEALVLNKESLTRYFPPEARYNVREVSPPEVDRRRIVRGHPLRCIDRHFGIQEGGIYDPDAVPLSPAIPGAIDIIAATFNGSSQERMASAVAVCEALGVRPADHSAYIENDKGKLIASEDGCAFRNALNANQLEGMKPLDQIQAVILKKRHAVHRAMLHRKPGRPLGMIINTEDDTTVLPNDGQFYVADLWFMLRVGMSQERALEALAQCADLLLPKDRRNILLAQN